MAGSRERIRMTDDEVAEFLTTERTLQVASIGPDGAPHLVPMWFALIDGRVAMWTYAKSQKAANLRRDPRLTCLVEAESRKRVAIFVEPVKTLSWDHRKL